MWRVKIILAIKSVSDSLSASAFLTKKLWGLRDLKSDKTKAICTPTWFSPTGNPWASAGMLSKHRHMWMNVLIQSSWRINNIFFVISDFFLFSQAHVHDCESNSWTTEVSLWLWWEVVASNLFKSKKSICLFVIAGIKSSQTTSIQCFNCCQLPQDILWPYNPPSKPDKE